MTTLARIVYGLLVLATFAAFFVAQRLKHSPTVVQKIELTPVFSPTGHSGLHREKISFRIKQSDEVTVTIVNSAGDDIATLARSRHLPAYTQLSLRWDGVTDAGRLAPDGLYQVRFRLRNQARTVEAPRPFRLKSTAPRPTVTVSAPGSSPSGPLILPLAGRAPVTVSIDLGGGAGPSLELYRTDVTPAQPVIPLPVPTGAHTVTWDGTDHGRPLSAGTYVVTVTDTDAAGNVGSSPPALPPSPVNGATVPGHAGVTVRYAGVQPPVTAVPASAPVGFGVDTRRVPYTFAVQRVGAPRASQQGRASGPLLRIRAPGGPSGVYTLSVSAGGHSTTVPFAVQGSGSAPVLVVLPAISWLGQDPLDDDGDGLPDTLDFVRPVLRQRIFAAGLPTGFSDRIAPVLAFLDRHHLRYDLTTDLGLAASAPAVLAAHRGVLLVGDERWLTLDEQNALKGFVAAGGGLASLGVDSLRRTVSLTAGSLTEPSPPAPADLFGARLGPLATGPVNLTDLSDGLGLFTGGTGLFAHIASFEPTIGVGAHALLQSKAVTSAGQAVIVAERYGRGLVIRTGYPQFAARLRTDPNSATLMNRIWQLISR